MNAASSTDRCNTIQCIDSTMLPRENYLFGCVRPKPSQGSVPAGSTIASDFGFCFQCKVGSSLVLRRPIEITALIAHLKFQYDTCLAGAFIRWDEKAGLRGMRYAPKVRRARGAKKKETDYEKD
jgi:hypothetical protein